VDGAIQESDYPRHDSPYARTARKAQSMTIEFGGRRLLLDYKKGIRREE
jgi:hypothetical protein